MEVFLVCITLAMLVNSCEGQSKVKWQPEGCSKETWMKQCGCDVAKWEKTQDDCQQLRNYFAEDIGLEMGPTLPEHSGCICMEDYMFDEKQKLALASQIQEMREDQKRRKKRKIRTFTQFPIVQWETVIYWKTDGDFNDHQESVIKEAISWWTKNSCLQFIQIGVNDTVSQQHLVFVKYTFDGCFSYIGKVDKSTIFPQPIFLGDSCFSRVGYPAHEVGHALGLFHEHQRPDRDEFINLQTRNIRAGAEANFAIISSRYIEDLGVPYDLGSLMHYRAYAFSKSILPTIRTNDERYQKVIGQRVEVSFQDLKVINRAYCSSTCGIWVITCENDGYQNPTRCNECLCSDGWTGDRCQLIASPVNSHGGGNRIATPFVNYLDSPGYGTVAGYNDYIEVYWLITAPLGHRVFVTFEGQFGIYEFSSRCSHWVELRMNSLSETGYRYCGSWRPDDLLVSKGNKAMVLFKTNITPDQNFKHRKGFRLAYFTEASCQERPCQNGGTCLEMGSSIRCLCPLGYGGTVCQHRAVPFDIAMLLDTSFKHDKDLYAMKELGKCIMNHIDIGTSDQQTSAGVITYDEYAHVVVGLDRFQSLDSIYSGLSKSRVGEPLANLYLAMWIMQTDMFYAGASRNRPHAPDVAFIVTDSRLSDAGVPMDIIMEGFNQARRAGITIIAVGIGPEVNQDELIAATGDEKNVLFVNHYGDLHNEVICQHASVLLKNAVEHVAHGVSMDLGVDLYFPESAKPELLTTTQGTSSTMPSTTTTTQSTTERTTTTPTTTTPTTTTPTTTTSTTTTSTTTTPTTTTSTTTTSTTTTTPTPSTTSSTTTSTSTTTESTTSRTSRVPTSTTTTQSTTISKLFTTLLPRTCYWEWGPCSDECGGCGTRIYQEWCIESDRTLSKERLYIYQCRLERPQKACVETCLTFVGRVYNVECGPQYCCNGLRIENGMCLPEIEYI